MLVLLIVVIYFLFVVMICRFFSVASRMEKILEEKEDIQKVNKFISKIKR